MLFDVIGFETLTSPTYTIRQPQKRTSYHTKRLRKGKHIITAYVRQAIITGERQKPPLPTA
jgi:hypothetical protein